MILNSAVEEIKGEAKVSSLKIKNLQTNELTEISTDGIFIEIGRIASYNFV